MRLQVLMIIGALAVLSASAMADTRKEMEALQKGFEKAILSKDMKWFEDSAAPDFHEVGLDGKKTTRAASLKMMKDMFQMGETKSIKTKILKLETKGKQTIITTDCHSTMTMKMPGSPKASKMESWMTYQETWSKEKGKWQIHELKSLKEKATMDGKPMPAGAMGG